MHFFVCGKYESLNQLFGISLYLIRSFSMVSIEGEFLSDVISGSPVSLCQLSFFFKMHLKCVSDIMVFISRGI